MIRRLLLVDDDVSPLRILAAALAGSDVTTSDRTIDTFAKRVREQIRRLDRDRDVVETGFGVGCR